MKPIQFAGAGILDSGQQLNPGNCWYFSLTYHSLSICPTIFL
jgi:hypothetical protein